MTGYWANMAVRFRKRPLGIFGLAVLLLFCLAALYAPFLASSKPIMVIFDGELYFPLFRYLLSNAFYTKKIDLFFNALSLVSIPFAASFLIPRASRRTVQSALILLGAITFVYFGFFKQLDPAVSVYLNKQKEAAVLQILAEREQSQQIARRRYELPSWQFELEYMNTYAKLNLIMQEKNQLEQYERVKKCLSNPSETPYTLYAIRQEHINKEHQRLQSEIQQMRQEYEKTKKEEEKLRRSFTEAQAEKLYALEEQNEAFEELENRLNYIDDKKTWMQHELGKLSFVLMPPLRPYHWEDDVGGEQELNLKLPLQELSRINGKDLVSALLFGSRISLFVGFAATFLALIIGIPLGLISGYYGGRIDILLSRFVEVWEAMPVFFMLLLVVAILQTKSIFVVIAVLSAFSWEGAFRFVRAETFKQRELLYVDASRALGFPDHDILLRHILPNSILAVLALLPFDIMSAITREAGLAFLGIGEDISCSWGVLMDEGRSVFPAVSSLLWPPALVLTVLLVAIAFVGEALQRALDPKSD